MFSEHLLDIYQMPGSLTGPGNSYGRVQVASFKEFRSGREASENGASQSWRLSVCVGVDMGVCPMRWCVVYWGIMYQGHQLSLREGSLVKERFPRRLVNRNLPCRKGERIHQAEEVTYANTTGKANLDLS
jgi:hypothetical protein